MSASTLLKLLNLRVLPTGRALFALRIMARLAAQLGAPAVEKRCLIAIATGKDALKLLMRYQSDNLPTEPDGTPTRLIDVMSDRNISGMFRQADNAEESFGASHPRGAAGRNVKRVAFPRGAGAITKLPYVEQLAAMEALQELLHGDLAADVATLGLEDWVERHDELVELYADSLNATGRKPVKWAEVVAMNNTLRANIHQAVVVAMAQFVELTDEHEAARAKLLAPLYAQEEAVSAMRKRRRKITDIDPITGVELDTADVADDALEPA